MSSISTAASVSVGGRHTCGVLSGGALKCWGSGEYGRLGNGDTSNQSTPVSVSISTVASASAGGEHTCAVLSGGSLKCWGYGEYGQLGNGSFDNQYTPVTVK